MRPSRVHVVVAVIFWGCIIGINIIRTIPFRDIEMSAFLQERLLPWGMDVFSFSIFYFLLIPLFIRRKHYLLSLFFGLLIWILIGFLWGWLYMLSGKISTDEQFYMIYTSSLGHTVLNTLYGIILYLAVDWFLRRRKQQELERENLLIKTNILKAQLDSHFLFNALNNIHSLTHEDNSKAGQAIIRLSEIMRYMLHEANQDFVPLSKELEYVRNYLELQRIRLTKEVVLLQVVGTTDQIMVAPLLFIPFIENAFKHGKKTNEGSIVIRIETNDQMIRFQCSNEKRETKNKPLYGGGIGLDNIKSRLNLLYGNRHTMEITETTTTFNIDLQLE